MSNHVLVTGGAGYIGSHACKALAAAGYVPVTLDNFSTGWRDAVRFGPVVEADLMDRAALDAAFAEWKPVAVLHFAALSQVGEAMTHPAKYWRNNVSGSLNLIEAAVAAGCMDFVFSSTCATYGDRDGEVLDENTPQAPLNAYGASKRAALTIHGTDYPTPDGTCIRDYVHVMDLVDAHVKGLEWLRADKGSRVFCLGTGDGFSVREVVEATRHVTNREVPMVDGPRRGGDAVKLVCGSQRAKSELGWSPDRSTMRQMITDAWRWHQTGDYKA